MNRALITSTVIAVSMFSVPALAAVHTESTSNHSTVSMGTPNPAPNPAPRPAPTPRPPSGPGPKV
jgi:hypothetical protein